MSNPVFNVGDTVYLRSSAGIGFLETLRISGIHKTSAGWVYTVYNAPSINNINYSMGDRKSLVNGAVIYFSESEFISYCDALTLIETNLSTRLDQVRTLIANCE